MSAVSDKTMKRLTWIDDKWTDFWYAIEKPITYVILGVWGALFGVWAVVKGVLWVLNIEEHSAFSATGAILFGVPVMLVVATFFMTIALLVAFTPLIVAGRVLWLAKNVGSLKAQAAEGGIGWALTSTIMFTIAGAIAGVYGLTHNAVGMEGALAFTGIGMAIGVGIGAWGMFGTAVAHRTGWLPISI